MTASPRSTFCVASSARKSASRTTFDHLLPLTVSLARLYTANMWTRLASASDLRDIARIDDAVCSDAVRNTQIKDAMAEHGCWVAGRTVRPEGYLVLSRRHFYGRDFVSLVIVAGSARRQGLAGALFGAAEANATTDRIFTSTNQSNDPMQALLNTRGYKSAGLIEHLDPGDPELVYVKYLR